MCSRRRMGVVVVGLLAMLAAAPLARADWAGDDIPARGSMTGSLPGPVTIISDGPAWFLSFERMMTYCSRPATMPRIASRMPVEARLPPLAGAGMGKGA